MRAVTVVALRKESVDRNAGGFPTIKAMRGVALRKESVDRNVSFGLFGADSVSSLSARRAWIEMDWASVISAMTSVALRKESVDRNVLLSR